MKAAVIHRFGGPEEIVLVDLPTPQPGAGQVLIKVLATLVTRIDQQVRQGHCASVSQFPHVLGEVAVGDAAELGPKCRRFRVGDRVMLIPAHTLAPERFASALQGATALLGTYAQYAVVSEALPLVDRSSLPPEQSVALPLALLTAARAVELAGEVKAGDKVLVNAGTSSTGRMCIQVARALGAKVAAIARNAEPAKFTRGVGAQRVFRADDDVLAAVRSWTFDQGVDVAIDLLGGSELVQMLKAVKPKGVLVSAGHLADNDAVLNSPDLAFAQKQIRGLPMTEIDILKPWLERVRKGDIHPIVDTVLPLSEAARAHQLVAENRTEGSVVLLPWCH